VQHDAPIDIQLLCPPLSPADCMELVTFLWHKGDPWVRDIHRRLAGGMPGARDFYFIARRAGELVGHVWYTTREDAPDLGLIGHVYTAPAHRRRGISARLVDAAMAEFRQRGGRVMQLFTSTRYTLDFYQRFGFENLYSNQAYHETDWYMCAPSGAHAELTRTLAAARVTVRPISFGTLPQYCFLYNLEHDTLSKDRAQPVGLGLDAELSFIHMHDKLVARQAAAYALGDDHLLAGVATLCQLDFPHQSHVGIVDAYTDPRFRDHVPQLIEACLGRRAELGIEFVYALAVDTYKRRQFEQLGFRSGATLSRHFRVGADVHDVWVYRRT